ncbi:MAG: rod shape-determining protein RodA [Ignavibacteriales bacterium]|nr:rod shape-determining protein RodA [Ignavibacteriales bacterium]
MNTFFKEYFDRVTFFSVLALVGIGLLSIYSATFDAYEGRDFYRQLLWALLGLLSMMTMMVLPLRWLQRSAFTIFFSSLSLLVLVLLIGKRVYGSQSWLGFAGLGIQPSEFVKITTMLAIASFLSRSDVKATDLKDLVKASAVVSLPIILIMMQPDFGTSLTFLAMFIPVLYWAGASKFLIIIIIAPAIVAAASIIGTTPFLIVLILLGIGLWMLRHENQFVASLVFGANVVIGFLVQIIYSKLPLYQQKRIATFLDPDNDPLGAGYNVIQAKVAIGSGGLMGKGFMRGTQTQLSFIPKQWTDFIFCVPGEEFGFLGGVVVLGLFAVLLYHGVHLSSIAKNKFSSLLAISITSLFAFHIFVNIGMSVGLMPVIGIPLPFLSYGGSSLVSYLMMAGLLMNVYANRKEY